MAKKSDFLLSQFLPYRMVRLSRHLSQQVSVIYAEQYDLTIPEWRVLANLSSHKQMSANQITRLADLDKVKVSRAVKRLADKKLLEQAPNPVDNRSTLLSLSTDGAALVSMLLPLVAAWEDELLAIYSREERQQFIKLIAKLENHFEL